MNLRHHRLLEMRHRFLAHSSVDGLKVLLVPPGVRNPNTGESAASWGYRVGKREFLREEYVDWMKVIIEDLNRRLLVDIARMLPILGPKLCQSGECVEISTPSEFSWLMPNEETT